MATSWDAVNVAFLDMPPSIAQASADCISVATVFLDLPPPNWGAGELLPEAIEWTDLFTIPDAEGPLVEYLSPEAMATLLSEDPIIFTVIDPTGNLNQIVVAAILHATGVHEIVHDGVAFAQNYSNLSSRVEITQGFEYTVRRNAGWPLGTRVSMRVWAVDTGGNTETTPGSS
jgi:hypothetical protein